MKLYKLKNRLHRLKIAQGGLITLAELNLSPQTAQKAKELLDMTSALIAATQKELKDYKKGIING